MKQLIFAAIMVSAPFTSMAGTPIESDSFVDDGITRLDEVIDELVGLVRASGYRCDSITVVRRMLMGGFELACNKGSYEYEIEDKGGHWRVTLQ